MMKRIPAWVLAVALAGCGGTGDDVETFRVDSSEFAISLITKGELKAAESTPITPPPGSRAPRTIRWLAPNFSWVNEGDVVASFDVTDAERQASTAGLEINKVDLQVVGKQRELDRQLSELGNDLELVDIEKIMADQFVVDNELAYSRFEIIDAMRDKVLLDYKSGHLEGKRENYSDRQGAEVAVLAAQRATQESKFDEQQSLLDNNEVRAPHAGYFVLEQSWFGQTVDIGSTVFAGNKFASIPNLGMMEAELHVLEAEAVSLAPGQVAEIVIDAYPDRPLTGRVKSISATAAPIERDNPVKYFTVAVTLDQSDPEWIKPGAIVSAVVQIDRVESAIAVPNQALYREDGNDWVMVREGGKLVRRDVRLGLRGPNRSQVVEGLAPGDEIALFLPGEVDA
ncbi:HlyD family efflux transporter periplasmic adaptor subunit [Marinihelvus fidelis]|uniref:HlyD family efflux transporter periplasmic adaptor subunit n=1 Tax=Marinihelvus fidelis TaxID=2613842 RepID=A0A5N0T911_9GAMM|nr:HlyD family efflux transporter periplasmic adaptor subunit [Marinihelvus fidelis]KAA9131505.1 HlyD family efflux transporter periplasmic adaptor subunit [Marinihelvus fidelis]